jgi:hypothetical protein
MNLTQIASNIGQLLLQVGAALLVLLIGWVVAKIVEALVSRLLAWVKLDQRIGSAAGDEKVPKVQKVISTIVYYFILLIAVVGALQVLGLTIITEPLNAMLAAVFAYLPSLIAGIVVIVAAWLVATILRAITRRLLVAANVDRRVGDATGTKQQPIARGVSEAVFWLIWLLFLPVILQTFGLANLVAPVMSLLNQLFAWIPNLIIASLIVLVGGLVARIIQVIVANFFAAIGTDSLADRVGLSRYMGRQTLSGLIGLLAFVIILIPVITAALQALGLVALTAPLTAMLTGILTVIPSIIAAIIVIVIAYFVGRVVGDLVASLLNGLGFDGVLISLGLAHDMPADGNGRAGRSPSQVVGSLVMVAIILASTLGALSILNLGTLAVLLSGFIVFAWHILVGVVIFGVGLWIASWLSNFILTSNWPRKGVLALTGRIVVISLSLAIGLSQMGLADPIIALAFGVPLIGIALAVGLAFGLGGREAASKQIGSWQASINRVDEQLTRQTPQAPQAINPPSSAIPLKGPDQPQ